MGRFRSVCAAFALVLAGACGSDGGNPAVGQMGGNNRGSGTFSAVIDGQPWASDANTIVVTRGSAAIPGSVQLTGTKLSGSNYTSLTLALGFIGGMATYPLGVNHGTTAGGTGLVTVQLNAMFGSWNTGFSGNAGAVTVTSLSGNRIAGTFHFDAPPQLGSTAPGTKVVTNGQFDLTLPNGFVAATNDNPGSKVSATLNGMAWNAATIVATGTATVFAVSANTTSYTLTFVPKQPLVAGANASFVDGVRMSVTQTGTSNSWGGLVGDAGTLHVDRLGGGRAAGTFSGTLAPHNAASAPLVITNGTFDLKINLQ